MELSNIRVFPYQSGTILKAPHVCIVSCGAKLGTVVKYPIEKNSLVVSCLPENLALIRVAVKIIEFAGVADIYAISKRCTIRIMGGSCSAFLQVCLTLICSMPTNK